jgi:hypothetical protein
MNSHYAGTTELAYQPAPKTDNPKADREANAQAYLRACWHYLDCLFRGCHGCPDRRELRDLADLIEALRPAVRS